KEADESVLRFQAEVGLSLLVICDTSCAEIRADSVGGGGQIHVLNRAEYSTCLLDFRHRLLFVPHHQDGNDVRRKQRLLQKLVVAGLLESALGLIDGSVKFCLTLCQGLDPIASEDKKPPRLCQLVRRRPPCILDNLTHDVITHSSSCVVIAKHGASLLDEGVGLFGRGKCAHRFSGKALFWKKTFVDAGDNVQRILIVDLLKYIVRQV